MTRGSAFSTSEMAPGDSSAGLGRLKPIADLIGPVPVVTDESDPLFMPVGAEIADGHSLANNTGELQAPASAEAPLSGCQWLKDTELATRRPACRPGRYY
jgi:hypothetical protein